MRGRVGAKGFGKGDKLAGKELNLPPAPLKFSRACASVL